MCVAQLESLTQGFRRCCMPLGPTLDNIPMSWFWHGGVKSLQTKINRQPVTTLSSEGLFSMKTVNTGLWM